MHLRRWQRATLLLLFVGYSGYYLCRSNLAVVTPLLCEELAWQNMPRADALDRAATTVSLTALPIGAVSAVAPLALDQTPEYKDARVSVGLVVSLGTLAYAIGKFLFGAIGDRIGGRRNFLTGMSGAVLFTIVFGFSGGIPLFTIAWIGNRFVQASGWPGLVKVAGRWFDYRWHGTALAILSLSFLFGDFAAREFMWILLLVGLSWRTVFFVTGGVLAGILAVCFVFLKESPNAIGEVEAAASPANVYGDRDARGLLAILLPLLERPAFWIVCVLSIVMTLLRETFNTWSSEYFKSGLHFDVATAAMLSVGFPLLGGCSTLAAGYLSDRLGTAGRSLIMFTGLLLTAASLFYLSGMGEAPLAWLAVALVAATGFFLLGPYSYLAGAVALDFGGKQGSATACGIIDGVGYLASYFAGQGIAVYVKRQGWASAWSLLGLMAIGGCVAAAIYWIDQLRRVRAKPRTEHA
jgi:OPA family glycerol-3-phosphate transporter-like MFS transporter